MKWVIENASTHFPLEVFVRLKSLSTIASLSLVFSGSVVLAHPAQAADITLSCASSSSQSITTSASSYTIAFNANCNNVNWTFVTPGSGVTVTTNASANVAVSTNVTISAAAASPLTVTNPSGTKYLFFTFTDRTGGGPPFPAAELYLTFNAGGGNNNNSSSSTPTPVTETLSLAVAASGATCAGGNPTGYSGSWLTLPSADQCSQSGPTAMPGAKLLGWSTSANFPIARAQSQVDKKWGVIDEEIDGIRMVFIPGGMATFVSGSNNLFPVWSI